MGSGWRGIAGGVRVSAATLAALQAVQSGGARVQLSLALQWQCGRPAGACAGLGACLPGALWPGARAEVGAVGEMSDPGTRGAGAFHSGRSAGLRLRPRLRRAWSGVPPASSGAEFPLDALRADACPLAVVGGLGGVGVLVGRWGSAGRPSAAGSAVLLVGRRGRVGADVRPGMRWYEQWDGVACLARGDAGSAEEGAVWAQRAVRGMSAPVAGVVHTAGVLGDGTLGVQDV